MWLNNLVTELDILVAWHQATKIKGAKEEDQLNTWKEIVANG